MMSLFDPHNRLLGGRLALGCVAVAAAALLGACSHEAAPATPASTTQTAELPALKVVDPAYMDTTVKACTDFNLYANGGWLKTDTIPAAYSETGVFKDMADRNELVVRSVLEDAMAKAPSLPDTSTEHKLGTFYASCMDSSSAESAGVTPIAPELAAIDSITTPNTLIPEVARLQMSGTGVLFRYGPSVNAHDSQHYIADFDRGGLGMPDRDYYLNTAASADSMRRAYRTHITKTLVLGGEDSASAAKDADRVISLETEMAKAQLPRVARRDPKATDHQMAFAKLHTLAPDVDWTAYLHDVGLASPVSEVNVGEPAYYTALNTLVAKRPIEDWRAYLRYHALSSASPWLSSAFVNENFAFASRFSGAKALLPRWKRCLRVTDRQLGEALGQAYVAKTFPPEARTKAKAVIDDIRAAFRERLNHLTWMSASTRAHAQDKLAKMGEKVGYPDKWRDYSKLTVTTGPFVLNEQSASRFEWERVAQRPGQPVDKTEWGITVPTVNAYYNPTKNEMVFPAGALVPQTFDPKADDGANYGSLGASWAGHEMTHGFDDEGRHYDAAGNLTDWWTPDDSKRFNAQAELDARQYDGYIQVDTFHVNGHLTLGENIADYGGSLTAYDALEHALQRDGRPGLIDGFTPEQRFFIAYAQSFRVHSRPENLRTRVKVDPHSPENWRVDGPLSDMEAFAKAFGCKPGDPMVRARNVVPNIW
ncbi:MAG TPA: M13 family metallopeptidase [Gemmatimonadaceae bacterium]|nr:M13 family metallopeptidase [Gemmatimonadaceae bacterium]